MYNGIVCPMRIQSDPWGAVELLEKEKANEAKILLDKKALRAKSQRKYKARTYNKKPTRKSKTVYLFSMECKYLRTFHSIMAVAEYFDIAPPVISKRLIRPTPLSVKKHFVSLTRNPEWEDHPELLMTEGRMKPVYRFDSDGVFVKKYETRKDLTEDIGISSSTVTQLINGRYQSRRGYRLSMERNPKWRKK